MMVLGKFSYFFCFLIIGLFLSKNLLSEDEYKWFTCEQQDVFDFEKENELSFPDATEILELQPSRTDRLSLDYLKKARLNFVYKCDLLFLTKYNSKYLKKDIDVLNLALNRVFQKVCEDVEFWQIQQYMGWL